MEHAAQPSPLLDAILLSPSAQTPTWARVPGDSPRRVASAFYLSRNATACAGRAPLVVQLYHYCDAARTATHPMLGLLRPSSAAKAGDIRFSQPSWQSNSERRSVAHRADVAVCELGALPSAYARAPWP